MKRLFALALLLSGCGGAASTTVAPDDTTPANGYVQYKMIAPFMISGVAPAGQFGAIFSSLPAAPLAADSFEFTFCFQGGCFTVSYPTMFLPPGETTRVGNSLTYYNNGVTACSTWTKTSSITWHATTPLHWNIDINADCADGSVSVAGNWFAIYSN